MKQDDQQELCPWLSRQGLMVIDLYEAHGAGGLDPITEKQWNHHRESCGSCREDWELCVAMMPLIIEDREALTAEPAPFFFARQFAYIRNTLEQRSQASGVREFLRRFQTWWHVVPRSVALASLTTLLAISWAVHHTGNPNSIARLTVDGIVAELALSGEILSLASEAVFAGNAEVATLLF